MDNKTLIVIGAVAEIFKDLGRQLDGAWDRRNLKGGENMGMCFCGHGEEEHFEGFSCVECDCDYDEVENEDEEGEADAKVKLAQDLINDLSK